MAKIGFDADALKIELSLPETVFSFHGSFRIPFIHITNIYVSNLNDLGVQSEVQFGAIALGTVMTGGIFTAPAGGTMFCDIHGKSECLVIETQGERFSRLAFTLDDGQELDATVRGIRARVLDSRNAG